MTPQGRSVPADELRSALARMWIATASSRGRRAVANDDRSLPVIETSCAIDRGLVTGAQRARIRLVRYLEIGTSAVRARHESVLNRLVCASRRLAELLAVGTRRDAGPL